MDQTLSQVLGELAALLAALAAPAAGDGRPESSLQARAKAWRDAALGAAEQAGSLDGSQAEAMCSALPGAAVALTHLESRAAQQQGSAPQWQSVAVKLLHGCAALAATCPNEPAPAVAALWQAAGPVLERSKRAIQAATAGLAEGGPLASRVLAGINSHSKLLIALLQRSCPAQPDGSQPAATPVPLQSLAAWLLAAAQALDKLRATCGLTDEYAVCLSRVLELLLLLDALPDSQRDSELVQQGQQHTALCGAVLDVLLPQLTAAAAGLSLPAEQRRPWCTWGHAAQCAAVATCGLIQPAIEELGEAARSNWDGPEAARLMRLLQAAATLALHMPASGAGDLQGADQLLALQHQPDAISGTNTAAAQLQQARQMLPLLARMASLMAQAGRSMPPLSELCTAAAWLVQFVGLLAIRCNEPECCLVRDLTEIPDWCAAASTALRMLPAATEAAQQAQQQPAAADAASQVVVQPATAEAADCVDEQLAAAGAQSAQQHRLSQLVLSAGVLVNGIGGQCVRLVGAQNTALVLDSPDVSAAIAELWQLHSTACRSAAWAGTRGVQQLLSSATETVHMDFHSAIAQPAIAVCSLVPRRAFNHHAGTLPKRARRQADSPVLAHLDALCAMVDASADAGSSVRPTPVYSAAGSLVFLVASGPVSLAAHPRLKPLFVSCMAAAAQDARAPSYILQLSMLKASSAPSLLLAALLLGTSVWEALGGSRLVGSADLQVGTTLFDALVDMVRRLVKDAVDSLKEAASGGDPSFSLTQLQSVLQDVRTLERGTGNRSHWSRVLARVPHAVAAPRSVAPLLLDHWCCPVAQEVAQLEMAKAAARRSCAYLRCANLGGEGGPAAGEGVGSMRCSACRAVWYCGTACSHAGWRAGHRHVCAALGAERQERKAPRQQQAAAATGGAGAEEC